MYLFIHFNKAAAFHNRFSNVNTLCASISSSSLKPEDFFQSKSTYHFPFNITSLLQKQNCTSLNRLKKTHAKIFSYGLQHNTHISTKLAIFYVQFHRIDVASILFKVIPNPCSYLWNIMIRGYADEGQFSNLWNFIRS